MPLSSASMASDFREMVQGVLREERTVVQFGISSRALHPSERLDGSRFCNRVVGRILSESLTRHGASGPESGGRCGADRRLGLLLGW